MRYGGGILDFGSCPLLLIVESELLRRRQKSHEQLPLESQQAAHIGFSDTGKVKCLHICVFELLNALVSHPILHRDFWAKF